jgi:hypothetical protein
MQDLTRKCHLPSLAELGKTLITKKLIEKVQYITSCKWEVTKLASKVTIDLIEHHLIHPTKVCTMIQALKANLEKDMYTLSDNIFMHKDALEESTYHKVMSLYDHLEIKNFYIRDK